MKSFGFYFKTIVLSILLGLETYILGLFIIGFIDNGSFFSIPVDHSIYIISLMLLVLFTFSLTVGAWSDWLQYIIIPFPIAIGIMLTIVKYSINHALLAGAITLLLLAYDIFVSSRIKNLLIKFDPGMILRFSSRGILFVYCLFAALLVIMQTTTPGRQINIGAKVAEILKEPAKNIIENQVRENFLNTAPITEDLNYDDILNIDPQTEGLLRQYGYGDLLDKVRQDQGNRNALDISPESIIEGINIEESITNQVNSLVEPYANFIKPLIALLVFGIFQLYAFIASVIFSLLVKLLYIIAKKTGFFKVEYIPVEKEILKF